MAHTALTEVCAIIGSMDRQGCCEFFMAVPLMLTVVPIYKHTVLTNALLFDLQAVGPRLS